nr:hypothetical protein [Actinoplanes maris]
MAEPEFAAAADEVSRRRAADDFDDDLRETVQFDPADVAAAKPSAGPDFATATSSAGSDFATATPSAGSDFATSTPSAGSDFATAAPSAGSDFATAAPSAGSDFATATLPTDPGFASAQSGPVSDLADQAGASAGDLSADERPGADDPDRDRASATINAARSDTPDDSWDRETPAAPSAADEDFDEPAADDPDDEPLPQAVQPADAVRLAHLDAEVLVVDGRPRYHLAECPSLAGRLTEPIPVREAVELGFSPCGLCRPVDHLVGAAARR